MNNKSQIVWVRDEITPGIQEMPSKIRQGIANEFRDQAPKVQSYMKRTASWSDQTGNARAGLTAEYVGDRDINRIAIRLAHGVSYGIWLEVKYAGKYAVIRPTLVDEGDRIMAEMRGFLGRLTGGSSFTPGLSGAGLSL